MAPVDGRVVTDTSHGGFKFACAQQKGRVEVIVGPMFSGKSSELFRRVRRHSYAKHSCLVLTHTADTRYNKEGALETHDHLKLKGFSCAKLFDAVSELEGIDVIAIDEGHFFPDLVEFVEAAANAGFTVHVAGLDATYQRRPFDSMATIMATAEDVIKFSAVCSYCGANAAFTLRTTAHKEVQVVGGAEMYAPACRSCYFAHAHCEGGVRNGET